MEPKRFFFSTIFLAFWISLTEFMFVLFTQGILTDFPV